MMKKIVLSTLLFAISCSTATTAAKPSLEGTTAASTAPASPSASANAGLGSMFSMPTERDMVTFQADRGALVASRIRETPPPYDSKIVRAEAPSGPWKLVYESDAMFMVDRVSSGRIGLVEYREPVQGGGAYSEVFVVVDLASGQKIEIDRFSLSAATYHGGGGGPRRPVGAIVLGPDHVAWTRLVEGTDGSVIGELRIAPLADPKTSQLVATTGDWLRPLDVDGHRLVYVLGGKTEDTLHVRDLNRATDKVLATGAVGNTARGEVPGFDYAAVSGDWAVWLDDLKVASTKAHALNLASGDERALEVGGSQCSGVSAGARYFVWACGKSDDPRDSLIIDAKTLDRVQPIAGSTGVGIVATADGLLWFNVTGNSRTVTLFTP
jgi:hypothetical protein